MFAVRQAAKDDNNLSIVKLLIEFGINVNSRIINKYGDGDSALDEAVKYYHAGTECIDYLLTLGADTNVRNKDGFTPLATLAKYFGIAQFKSERVEYILEKLLEHGAEITEVQEYYYNKGLCYAVESNYSMLKPLVPKLDTIINKVKDKVANKLRIRNLTVQKLVDDLKKAAEEKVYANQPIRVSSQTFNLNKEIVSTRCPKLLSSTQF